MSWLTAEERERLHAGWRHPGISIDPDSDRTKQEFRDECDVNKIISGMEAQGLIQNFNRFGPDWAEGEVDAPESFHEAMNMVVDAQQRFEGLPSKVRAEFANDPARFLDFMSDPDNRDRAVDLGLLPPRRSLESKTPPEEGGKKPKASTKAKPPSGGEAAEASEAGEASD